MSDQTSTAAVATTTTVATTAAATTVDVTTPLSDEVARSLHCGDMVSISGVIYTGRDAAHQRMAEAAARGEALPVDWDGQVIYYAGPTPARPGAVIGSCGPTTSGRMDAYAPLLMERGLRGMVGKGPRSPEVVDAMREHGVVYFAAIGGAAALIAASVRECEVVAYPDLGPEAIRRLVVEGYPAIVVIDSEGNNLYETGPAQYRVDAAE